MLALGVYPLTSLRAVREAHLELRRQLASGVSPSKVRIKPVELQRAQDGTLFKALVMDWLDERGKDTKPKTLRRRRRSFPVKSIAHIRLQGIGRGTQCLRDSRNRTTSARD